MKYFIFLILLSTCSCSQEQVFNGELGFQVVGIGPLKEYKDSNGNVVIEKFDTLSNTDYLAEWEIDLKTIYDYRKMNNVLEYKRILFGTEEDFDVVYLPEDEFKKIRHYNRGDLGIAKRKVLLSILGIRIDDQCIKGIKILDINEVQGSTFYKK